ncbi:hypothetical protein Clacol_009172 [Clathrus columnatus]|uniref:Transketolase-like pyrimidine-binding domain-containing protein n=1 Tax=Clathrus columnatus TaxID=1419009 RepID=A0AAV5AM96_9AGAM|nr:hypothetical protein Clacol_009172 [Clathrus columnatus]
MVLKSRTLSSAVRRCWTRRRYHDESFGYRKRPGFELPDYTSAQLQNRTDNAALMRYADALRTHGHRAAKIDPLDLLQREEVAALDPGRYGLHDMQRQYNIDGIIWHQPPEESRQGSSQPTLWPLRRIIDHLRTVYVSRVAYEYMHSTSKTERLWFSHLLESTTTLPLQDKIRKRIWQLLARSESFDQFLQARFPNLKRYGLEGGESMIPAFDALFAAAAKASIQHVILAMPHRGRLNLLTEPTLLQFSLTALFHKIRGESEFSEELPTVGDVMSHLTANPTIKYPNAEHLQVSLLPNPSHLEAINPVALGLARAKQYTLLQSPNYINDPTCNLGDKVMCVQVHGDASFTGQGIVMESLGLSNLPHYTSGGSVHLVVNIGYTTPAEAARSSQYCSDVAKLINAPILHVNGDYPEDVARAMEVAFQYRNTFRKDVVVDLMVYRRWGHNELDEPAFTQPRMYKLIRSRKSVPTMYEESLIDRGILTEKEATLFRDEYKTYLEEHLTSSKTYTVPQGLAPSDVTSSDKWTGIVWPAFPTPESDIIRHPETGVELDLLHEIGEQSVRIPEGFEIHPRLTRHVKHRLESISKGRGIDWATAEALAWGSLMRQGHDVRISGQDVGRGTFSHRHAMFVDQNTEDIIVPLNATDPSTPCKLELANSSLSELAVLGFEYGLSWERPNLLPIWEAQFGDFFNGAQVIIDTFISSGEAKWLRQSGLVILLPHGLDGAGPEHSSMRIERFLQLTNDTYTPSSVNVNINMHIANPTTPAQYFHLLRRQQFRNYRKPLVLATPKGLLRAPVASSTIDEFVPGRKFQPVLVDPHAHNPNEVRRIIFCSGKVYYDLMEKREEKGLKDQVALCRVEELAPFPWKDVMDALQTYAYSERRNIEVVWVQEEPKNQGPWPHVGVRLELLLKEYHGGLNHVTYVGRKESAVPAVGIGKLARAEKVDLLEKAFESV